MTGTTRRSSSSASTGTEPGRVLTPPTSSRSAPAAASLTGHARSPAGDRGIAPVGEAVGGDVEDAHQERRASAAERPRAEFPAWGGGEVGRGGHGLCRRRRAEGGREGKSAPPRFRAPRAAYRSFLPIGTACETASNQRVFRQNLVEGHESRVPSPQSPVPISFPFPALRPPPSYHGVCMRLTIRSASV